jgi:cytidylate kinase
MSGLVLAIDGPAASGKSTTARRVADRLSFHHVNSGLLYRAITWLTLREGWDEHAADYAIDLHLEESGQGLDVSLNGVRPGAQLHSQRVSGRVSSVSKVAAVRSKILEVLREAGRRFHVVCDGRDIGTVVFPDARLKVFLVASVEERARRRLGDYQVEATAARLREEVELLRARDEADSGREIAPLRPADDAVRIDSTRLGFEEVVDRIVNLWKATSELS